MSPEEELKPFAGPSCPTKRYFFSLVCGFQNHHALCTSPPVVAYVLINLGLDGLPPARPFPTSKVMTPVFQAHTNASPSRMKVS
jgi:hypothetical protein